MWQPVIRQLRARNCLPAGRLFDSVVSVVALPAPSPVEGTDFHQAGKMEFHSSFDLTRRNVVTTRFQTFCQLFGTAEHAHRLATDMRLEKAQAETCATQER